MKLISYAGNSVLTGDDIADAVVHYAEALARSKTSAALDLPVLDSTGRVVTANLLIGPSSQLVVMPAPGDGDELVDVDVVDRVHEQTMLLGSPTPSIGEGRDPFDRESRELFSDLEFPGDRGD